METAFALAIIAAWTVAPNAALALVTFNRADEGSHFAFGASCFIPWTLYGLSLTT